MDRAIHLPTATTVSLSLPEEARVGLGDGVLVATGQRGGLFRLTLDGAERVDQAARVVNETVAPPGVGDREIAVLEGTRLLVGAVDSRARAVFPTTPAGWYGVAVGDGLVAWVVDGGATGEDVWMVDTSARHPTPTPLAQTAVHERHVVASGRSLAWVEGETLVQLDTTTRERSTVASGTGFSAPPTAWDAVLCWEERGTDVDIVCSDGARRDGPGHQQWPSRWDRWLLYRQQGDVLLYTVP